MYVRAFVFLALTFVLMNVETAFLLATIEQQFWEQRGESQKVEELPWVPTLAHTRHTHIYIYTYTASYNPGLAMDFCISCPTYRANMKLMDVNRSKSSYNVEARFTMAKFIDVYCNSHQYGL